MRFRLAVLILTVLASCTPGSPEETSRAEPSPSSSAEASLSYVVKPAIAPAGIAPRATFTNTGTTTVEYGNAYMLERQYDGQWNAVEQPPNPRIHCAFTSEAYVMGPGASRTQRISVCDREGEPQLLEPGRYRVTKTARLQGSNGAEITVRASFVVIEPWSAPTDYEFDLESSCGERSLIGRFHVVVRDAKTTAKGLDERAKTFLRSDLGDVPSLGDLLKEAAEARSANADVVEISYNVEDGHPTSIDIDYRKNAIDDEACYVVTNYSEASRP